MCKILNRHARGKLFLEDLYKGLANGDFDAVETRVVFEVYLDHDHDHHHDHHYHYH
jgi:hypothetical protein